MSRELSVEEMLRRLRAAHAVRVNRVPALAETGTLYSDAADLIEMMDSHICELSGCSEDADL